MHGCRTSWLREGKGIACSFKTSEQCFLLTQIGYLKWRYPQLRISTFRLGAVLLPSYLPPPPSQGIVGKRDRIHTLSPNCFWPSSSFCAVSHACIFCFARAILTFTFVYFFTSTFENSFKWGIKILGQLSSFTEPLGPVMREPRRQYVEFFV